MAEPVGPIEAVFNYLERMEGRPTYHLYRPEGSATPERPRASKHAMEVQNGREGRLPSLDVEGVALHRHESAVGDFYDPEEVRRVYYPEVERLVGEVLGSTRVLVFDHNVRCGPRNDAGEQGVSAPVTFVHNDYTERSGPQRVRDLVGGDEAERLIGHRFAFINVWRPIRGPVIDTPLAVCDATSMGPEDFVPTDLVYEDRVGEIYSVAHNAAHRWFYFPEMQPDEVMLLKCYDADRDRARFTAHSAFRNPDAPPGVSPRESIETRTIAFFAPDA